MDKTGVLHCLLYMYIKFDMQAQHKNDSNKVDLGKVASIFLKYDCAHTSVCLLEGSYLVYIMHKTRISDSDCFHTTATSS